MSQDQRDDTPHNSEEEQENQSSSHQAETDEMPSVSLPESARQTRPTAPYQVSEEGGPMPDLDEGPRPEAVDEIQAAILEASTKGAPTQLNFEDLPAPIPVPPTSAPSPSPETTQPMENQPNEAESDEILQALLAAKQQGGTSELDFESLPKPTPFPQKRVSRPTQPIPKEAIPVETQASSEPETEAPISIETEVPPVEMPDTQSSSLLNRFLVLTPDFWLILTVFTSFRLLTLFLFRPGGYIRDWSDFDTYLGIASLSDYSMYPFLDFWLEWPPLIPWLTVGIYRLSLWLPPWGDDPRLWFILMLGFIFLLFEIGNLVLINRIGQRLINDPATRTRLLWLYAGLFTPVYTMLGFFDGVALFFILLALDWILQDQRLPSAVTVSVGFLVKIVPAIMLPVAIRRIWHQNRNDRNDATVETGLYGVFFGLAVLILLTPFLIFGLEWVVASARSMAGRSAWETVWAVLDGYYGFGVVAGERLNPAETNFGIPGHQSTLPWWVWLWHTAVFGVIYLLVFIRPADYSQPRKVIALAGFTVSLFLLYSKGYSPQFLVYLLPFIILLMPDARGLTYALMLTGLNVLEQPIYFVMLPDEQWLLIFIVIARFVLITLLVLHFLTEIWPTGWLSPLIRFHPQIPLIMGTLSAVAVLILTPLLLSAYSQNRAENGPTSTFIGFMEAYGYNNRQFGSCQSRVAQPPLLLSEQALYRELVPYLNGELDIRLTAGAPQQSRFPSPATFLPEEGIAWLLPTGPQASALQNLSNRGRLLTSLTFEGLGTAAMYDFSQGSLANECAALARYGTGIQLLTYKTEISRDAVELTLYWRAITPQNQDLTVFTQLLTPQGQQISGDDNIPNNGTAPVTTWAVDVVQADLHRIELPPDLPAGQYQIITGLYNSSTLERITSTGFDGQNHSDRAVTLETIRLP